MTEEEILATAPAEGSVIVCPTLDEWSVQLLEHQASQKLAVVYFTARWCGPCRLMAPIFADAAKKFTNLMFLKVDVDELKSVAEMYSVEAMPTFLFLKDGEVVDKVVGAAKEELCGLIERHSAASATVST